MLSYDLSNRTPICSSIVTSGKFNESNIISEVLTDFVLTGSCTDHLAFIIFAHVDGIVTLLLDCNVPANVIVQSPLTVVSYI